MPKRLASLLLAVVMSIGLVVPAHADGGYWTDQGIISTGGLAIVTTETHAASCPICTPAKYQPDPDKPNFNCGGPENPKNPNPPDPNHIDITERIPGYPSNPSTPPEGQEITVCPCWPVHPGKPCEDPTSNCPCIPAEPCCKPSGFDITAWDKVHCPCEPTRLKEDCHCLPGCNCDPNNPPMNCDCVEVTSLDGKIHIFEDELLSNLEVTDIPRPTRSFTIIEPSPWSSWVQKTGSCDHRGCGRKGRKRCCRDGDYIEWRRKVIYGEIKAWLTSSMVHDIRYVKDNNSAANGKFYDVMRQGSVAQVKFNSAHNLLAEWKQTGDTKTGNLVEGAQWENVPKFGNPYSDMKSVEWIAHRFAGKEDSVVVAKYMEKQNLQYIQYMNKAGITPKQLTDGSKHAYDLGAKSYATKLGLGGKTQQIKYSQKITESLEGRSGSGCTRGMRTGKPQTGTAYIVSGYADRIEYGQQITVDATYAGKSLPYSPIPGLPKVSGTATKKSPTTNFMEQFRMTKASPEFPFYATYKMTADYTPGVSKYNTDNEEADVWMLGKEKRTFQGIDILDFKVVSGSATISTPWSRDSEDKSANMPVSKAGSAYEFTGTNSVVEIDGWFHLIDPAFAPDEATANSLNQQQIQHADRVFQSIIDTFNRQDSVGVYSNVSGASTDSSGIQFPDGRVDKDKEQIRIIENAHSASLTKTYSYLPGYNGSQTSGRSYSGKGLSVANASFPGFNNSQTRLTDQLETDGGVSKKWYNEDYEGIIVAHYHLVLSAPTVQSDFISWFKYQSDWKTALNATSPECNNRATGNTVIDAKKGFVTGVDFYLGNVDWGKSIDMHVLFDPYLFGLRGSAFDNAR